MSNSSSRSRNAPVGYPFRLDIRVKHVHVSTDVALLQALPHVLLLKGSLKPLLINLK
jgi:hypothetical protein